MSAVATKPRAANRVGKAAELPTWADHVAQVRKLVGDSMQYAAGALQKVSTDNHAHGLLNSACSELARIRSDLGKRAFSEADADFLSSDGMYPCLAMLAGASSLAEADPAEAALLPAIQLAYERADQAHSALDAAVIAPLNPPAAAASWAELARAGVTRLSTVLQRASEADIPQNSSAFNSVDDAMFALHFMAEAPLTDSLWASPDPSHAIAVLQCIGALLQQGLQEHAQHGGLTQNHAALMPGALATIEQLSDGLLEAGGGPQSDLSQLIGLQSFMDAALAPRLGEKPYRDQPCPPIRQEPTREPPVIADSKPYALPSQLHTSLFMRLDHAEALLMTLVHVFGGDADTDEPCKTPGLMGAVQHVQHLLDGLHLEMQEIKAPVPENLRWRTFEASDLVNLLEHLAFNDSFRFSRMSDRWTCSYFDAILHAVRLAKASLDEVGPSHD